MIPSLSAGAPRAWALRPQPLPEPPKAAPAPSGPRVVVDPGHGGVLTGAQGANGPNEKDVNLAIAFRLAEALKSEGMDVIVTRDTDRAFFPASLANASYHEQQKSDLGERTRQANGERPDLFISIHANWAPTPDAEGFEVYYPATRHPAPAHPPLEALPFDWSAYGNDAPRSWPPLGRGPRGQPLETAGLAECVRKSMRRPLPPDRGARQADHG